MDALRGPAVQPLQGGDGGLQHGPGHFRVGLGLLVGEQSPIIVRQGVEKVHLLWDVGELLAPGLEQAGDLGRVQRRVFHALADIGLCRPGKVRRLHGPQVEGVEVGELLNVKDSGGLGYTRQIKGGHQLLQREYFLFRQFSSGGPAQQGHIVQDGVG